MRNEITAVNMSILCQQNDDFEPKMQLWAFSKRASRCAVLTIILK